MGKWYTIITVYIKIYWRELIFLKITSVDVHKVEKEDNRMKGIASVLIDDCFVVRDIRIIEGDKGLFIAMPSRKVGEDRHKDIAHPTNSETRQMFTDAILEAYEKLG